MRAVLTLAREGKGTPTFLVVTLDDVVVTSVFDAGEQAGVTESVTLACRGIGFAYHPQDAKGVPGAPVTAEWNPKTGKIT